MFKPKLFTTLKGYTTLQLGKDVLAGIIVGIVALPLAIAFAIASGVSPEKGLITAVIAGFIISVMGGSRVQIGGPTGAFIVIVYGIVQTYGIDGLTIATFMAGILLLIMGLARIGSVIKFIPYPLVTGFTSGIALIIFASQIKDFMGLSMGAVPADFIAKWEGYIKHIRSVNVAAVCIGMASILIIQLTPKVTRRIPGSLIALLLTTAVVLIFHLPVETIGSRFGSITASIPLPSLPHIDYALIKNLIQPAFAIALLGGIESLLSAVVADGMIGSNHKSNIELVAQGTANIFSSLFGGIPATGAIARTATNVKNGGRTPVAGIVHALTLLLIMLVAGQWAVYIPMPALAGILIVVAYNMSEWENFVSMLRGPKGDRLVLLVTFLLTVLVDLTVAIAIGMILAAFQFMRQMIENSKVTQFEDTVNIDSAGIPAGVEVFEITGPLFFGAAYKFREAMRLIESPPKVLIIRMRHVTVIDATGIKAIREIHKDSKRHHTRLLLAEVNDTVKSELKTARLLFAIGKANVTPSLPAAIDRSHHLLHEQPL
ncbi:SulP family inorganic anion transporter [Flavihumibacter petaseus]|uniref:C4-dicarboxylic acid transporter DauA n=1 Tax=Flavihumibacter petaseus NBRC 106054 TaxID=1220578 RepID=A0A0E9N6N8_9BACT|nr:sulfate permease [Flavihumibacter petaseus]GAO45489.1 C4-dicarboxylic acid transporter DauA [Flavihumibacter petaseus NBRC 106054]